jgi:drug/metabolite transporter (DMT)-like permease
LSPAAIALVLTAAIAHASWNLFSKQAAATGAVFFLWLLAMSATLIYLPVVLVASLLTSPHLTALNWVFLAGTGVIQAGYFLFLQLGYGLGDLSLVYPVGRGTGALLAATAGIVLLGERPAAIAIIGIAAIIAGVAAISLPNRADSAARPSPTAGVRGGRPPLASTAIGFALVTGAFIAAYTIWDKYAVGNLHTPPLLQGYAAFPFMALAFWPFVARDRARLATVWHEFRPQILGAGALAPLAYILVLAALSFTAVSAIAPAREVSVLFGVLLGRRLLGEGGLARRLAGAALIVAGIIAIALG